MDEGDDGFRHGIGDPAFADSRRAAVVRAGRRFEAGAAPESSRAARFAYGVQNKSTT